ncbi:ABC transporter ATP-binding protein [Planosporangium mesophilum]|uniref:Protein-tyrosine-phosphatase n=1 Tax=Planosporangium mesophilum TaxID=689768 RepID=A0A8J3TGB5_9ACTN|nr:ABC transporter ATP-binding protein [Planosporangium mesophilum]NJC81376.1 ABC transporter ATP-binding protein [Planosporangium mesophilum]GII20970.1 protein-tyrosine-phosphatase [Planosporangium mesophilum]
MWRFLWPYRAPLAVSASLAVADTVLSLARPWPLSLAVDHAINHRPLTGWLWPLGGVSGAGLAAVAAVGAIVLVALSGVTGYLTSYLSGAAAERIGADMRETVYKRLLTLSPRFHDRNRSGDLVTRLTGDVSRVQDSLVAWLVGAVPDVLTLIGLLVVMFMIDPAMTVVALVVVPPLALLAVVRRRQIKAAQREARSRQGDLASRAAETLRHVRAVQAFAQQEAETGRFRRENVGTVRASLRALDLEARYGPAADLLLAAGSGLVLWLGVVRVTSGRMSLGVLLVVLAYLGSMYRPVRSLTRLASTLARGAASRERLNELLDSTEYVREPERPVPVPASPLTLAVDDVSFGYDAEHPVLRGIDLTLRRDEMVCLVGATGVGKSTLLSLLLRLYDPDSGAILLDGVDLKDVNTRPLRDRISLVPQDPWILDGTIADNIAFGQPFATREEVERAARTALVHPFVEALPAGYDTVVGEGGVMLSGGQRRRLALARALLRDAPVLLLDEPTSGLDAESEHAVMSAITRAAAGRMTLVVSHRLRVATLADRVLVLSGGRITEAGAPAELVARGGTFADWCRLQNVDATRPARHLMATG